MLKPAGAAVSTRWIAGLRPEVAEAALVTGVAVAAG